MRSASRSECCMDAKVAMLVMGWWGFGDAGVLG